MAKRGNAEGSIYQRTGRSGWYAAVSQDGKRKILRGETRREVSDMLRQALDARDRGALVVTRSQTVESYLSTWLTDVSGPKVKPRTTQLYEFVIRAHIVPVIGKVRLDRLTPAHVSGMLQQATAAGLSPRTVQITHGVLRNALNDAVRWRLVGHNVARDVDGPRVERHEIEPLSPAEARSLLVAVEGDRQRALYGVAVALGLRQGELMGLRWQDIDLDAGLVHVRHQLQRLHGVVSLVPLKTTRSRRTIAVPGSILSGLRAHRQGQIEERLAAGPGWRGLEPNDGACYVFTTVIGTPLESRNVIRRFKAVLRQAGLPERRFHDLRHSCATLLLAQGTDLRTIMDVLGHSQISLTMNTYSHVMPELRREAADRMEAILGG